MPRDDFLTLSREDLYELVWSKPVRDLAADFGLSDVALAKRCRKLAIPVPGRGYWARVDSGQEPYRPKLPSRESRPEDQTALAFPPPPTVQSDPPAPPVPPEVSDTESRIAALEIVPVDLAQASPPVQRLARDHRLIPGREIKWRCRADRHGPVPDVTVSAEKFRAAAEVLDLLLRGAQALGWPYIAPPPATSGQTRTPTAAPSTSSSVEGLLVVEGEPFLIRVAERRHRRPYVPTADEQRRQRRGQYVWMPSAEYEWAGVLSLSCYHPDRRLVLHTWSDGKRRRLVDQVRHLLLGLYELSQKDKAHRLERSRWEAAERERARVERERAERRELEEKLITELEQQAGAWSRAVLLRRYVRAARRHLQGQRAEAHRGSEPIDFLAWAECYADQLDPLHPSERNSDLTGITGARWDLEHDALRRLARLAGLEGQVSQKLRPVSDPVAGTALAAVEVDAATDKTYWT